MDLQDQLNVFQQSFAHFQERKNEIYSIWYSILQRWIYK